MTETPIVTRTGMVRPFVAGDREPLRRIIEATGVFRPEEIDIAVELMDEAIEDPATADYRLFTWMDAEGVVRGYYCVGPTPMTEATWDLYWIAVDPQLHGRGVGAVLIAHCEELVRSNGGKLIVVETSSQPKYDPTIRFYRRRGYEEATRIRDYYSPGDDLVILTKHLV